LSALVPRLLATVLAAGMLFLPAMLLAGMGIRPTLLPARFVRIIHGPAP
jgi:hypothetical protein